MEPSSDPYATALVIAYELTTGIKTYDDPKQQKSLDAKQMNAHERAKLIGEMVGEMTKHVPAH